MALVVTHGHGRAVDKKVVVGRDAELGQLGQLFDDHLRLVTVIGPPGIGKSQLARQHSLVAKEAYQRLIQVNLGEVETAAQLSATMAATLGCGVRGTELAQQEALGRSMACEGRTLLLLDDADMAVVALAAYVVVWLEAVPELDVLITSREALRIDGEQVLHLASLSAEEGATLFRTRARELASDEETNRRISSLITRLEGNPLAISLAALHEGTLGLEGLASRLSDNFEILATRRRDVVPRHASLRAAISTSWNLLNERAQEVLAACTVFRGGFTLEAVQYLLDAHEPEILDIISELRDKSLLRVSHSDKPRYSIYESVCDFAKYSETGLDRGHFEARHGQYYAGLADTLGADLDKKEALRSLDALELETANLTAVVRRFGVSDSSLASRAALPLSRVAILRGPASLAEDLLKELVSGPIAEIRAEALVTLAAARLEGRDIPGATTAAADGRSAAEEAGNESLACLAMLEEAEICVKASKLEQAQTIYQEIALRMPPDTPGLARATYGTALVAHLCGLPPAVSHYDDAIDTSRVTGDLYTEVRALTSKAVLLSELELAEEAIRLLERSAKLAASIGRLVAQGMARHSLGEVHYNLGNIEGAQDAWSAASESFQRSGFRLGEGFVDCDRARLALERGDAPEAIVLSDNAKEIAKQASFTTMAAFCTAEHAMADFMMGRFAIASERLSEAVESLLLTKDRRFIGFVLGLQALTHHRCARPEQAELVLSEASEQRSGHSSTSQRQAHEIFSAEIHGQVQEPCTPQGWESRLARRLVNGIPMPSDSDNGPLHRELFLGPEARWFQLDGTLVDLSRRGAVRRVLDILATGHEQESDQNDRGLSVFELFDLGWPGQGGVKPETAAQRVYWVMATLRRLGLEGILETSDEGYRIASSVEICRRISVP